MMQSSLGLQRVGSDALRLGLAILMLALAGCATGPRADRRDPIEPFNRTVFEFNSAVDNKVIKPVATTYRDVVPPVVRRGVGNFFHNLQDGWSVVNNTLQLKGVYARDSLVRFGVNTFIGFGGVVDLASEMKVERHTKDFGHTLGYWGVPPGPYLMIPLWGPSDLRDAAAQVVDVKGDLSGLIKDTAVFNSLTALRLINKRANLLEASAMLDAIALDKYTFTREAYLQSRRSAIYDGNPPEEVLPSKPSVP